MLDLSFAGESVKGSGPGATEKVAQPLLQARNLNYGHFIYCLHQFRADLFSLPLLASTLRKCSPALLVIILIPPPDPSTQDKTPTSRQSHTSLTMHLTDCHRPLERVLENKLYNHMPFA